jgi:thiamine-phosphate pyrophosphorylase
LSLELPRLYAILDAKYFSTQDGLCDAARDLVAGGVTLLQYRNKNANAQEMLEQARALKTLVGGRTEPALSDTEPGEGEPKGMPAPHGVRLIMNDRADLCLAAEFDGLHVGQDDVSPEAARRIIGPGRWLGVSTHNPEQIAEADQTSADYLAIGPVFTTSSKANPDPVIGLEGVRRARDLTRKPLVAIGGITRATARSVIDAGADSVAVISDLLREPRKSAEAFFAVLR